MQDFFKNSNTFSLSFLQSKHKEKLPSKPLNFIQYTRLNEQIYISNLAILGFLNLTLEIILLLFIDYFNLLLFEIIFFELNRIVPISDKIFPLINLL